jgi:hypothetical protein
MTLRAIQTLWRIPAIQFATTLLLATTFSGCVPAFKGLFYNNTATTLEVSILPGGGQMITAQLPPGGVVEAENPFRLILTAPQSETIYDLKPVPESWRRWTNFMTELAIFQIETNGLFVVPKTHLPPVTNFPIQPGDYPLPPNNHIRKRY